MNCGRALNVSNREPSTRRRGSASVDVDFLNVDFKKTIIDVELSNIDAEFEIDGAIDLVIDFLIDREIA